MTEIVLGTGTVLAACVQAGTGLGFALVLTPIAFALLPAVAAIVFVTALGLVLNLLVLGAERRRPRVVWSEVVLIGLAAIPGVAAGALVLQVVAKPVLQVAVGVALIAVTLSRLRAGRRSAATTTHVMPARVALGLGTGVLTTAVGITGPPVALWLARRGLAPVQIRDSLGALFLALGAFACIALAPQFGRAHLGAGLLALALTGVVGGHAIGRRLFTRIPAHTFDPLLNAVILAAGAASVVAGLGVA